MRNLLVAFFVVCTIWSCSPDDDNPTPADKSTQNGTDTFTGIWVTNFFNIEPDTFINTTFVLDRINNDSMMKTKLTNVDNSHSSSWLSVVDIHTLTGNKTYLYSVEDSGMQEVYLFPDNDSAFYHGRSLNDTNKYGRFYGTN